MLTFREWAALWGVSIAAVEAWERQQGVAPRIVTVDDGMSEAAVATRLQLEAARKGVVLFRNNVGAFRDARGRWVRYGLANDSKSLNEAIKSGDYIGIRRVTITQAHVGTVIGQFVSRETKAADWTYADTPRERAQRNWADLVARYGGDAAFCTGEGSL